MKRDRKEERTLIEGIGLDLVEIDRIDRAVSRNERFARRILSTREYETYATLQSKRRLEFLAGRFAAKEAFSKARGTGITKGCTFQDIEVLNDRAGAPVLYFHGAKTPHFITITHTKTVAAAQVICMKGETRCTDRQ